MILTSLEIENFRNISHALFRFDSDCIIIEGANGQGKTSVLESVFYLANLRSFRTVRTIEMRKFGTDFFSLSMDLLRQKKWKLHLEASGPDQRILSSDGIKITKASEFTGKIKTVPFLPDDPEIVSGTSLLRRRFFDMFLSMLDKDYFSSLQIYSGALKSRNYLLKNKKTPEEILNSYSSVLVSAGVEIVKKREIYSQMLAESMTKILSSLREELSDFKIRMRYTRETSNFDDYLKKLTTEMERDQQKGFTTFGPHLDDFDFLCSGRLLRLYGSRGQCRMISLALKLAELELLRQYSGNSLEETLVLVDDATGDLDEKAKEAFYHQISNAGQIFFAFTEKQDHFPFLNVQNFKIENGNIL